MPDNLYLCLDSHTSAFQYPKNHAGRFTFPLPAQLESSRGNDPVFVRLESVVLPRRLARDAEPLGGGDFVKIHLSELEVQTQDRAYSHTVGTLPYPPDAYESREFGTHTFAHAPFLLLRHGSQVRRFHVKITDLLDREVRFEEEVPALVWLKMTTEPDDDQFTIVCTSSHPTFYPHNSLGDFRSPLPQELSLGGYEVALLQLIVPPTLRHEDVHIKLKFNQYTHFFRPRWWRNTTQFVRDVQQAIQHSDLAGDLLFGTHPDGPHRGQVYFARAADAARAEPVRLDISAEFAMLCGERDTLGQELTLAPGEVKTFTASGPSIWNVMPTPYGMLNCSIIEPNIVGRSMAQTLQCVPLLMTRRADGAGLAAVDGVTIYEPEQLSYHAVTDHPFNTIRFTFTELDQRPKRLISDVDTDMVMVTLVFRKKLTAAAER